MHRALVSPAVPVSALVFSGGEVWSDDEPANSILQTLIQSVPGPSTSSARPNESTEEQNVSTYVRVFEDMVGTVIKEEKHLFDDEEIALLTLFAHLSYNARYLMVKLLLRKQETWHRLVTLKYESELGSVSAIVEAINELCKVDEQSEIVKKEEPEVQPKIAEGAATLQREQGNPIPMNEDTPELPEDDRPFVLARNEQEMDLKSLLEILRVDELKAVAKQLKLKKINQRKDDLIRDLLGTSSSQLTLTVCAHKRSVTQTKGCNSNQTRFAFGNLKSQQDRLKEIVLDLIVKCVRVDEAFFGVIRRVYLVYFRLTQHTPGIPVAALLTRFGKRAYPSYVYERTRNVWPSREALIEYEEVLILEAHVDSLLAGNAPLSAYRATVSKTPVARFLPTPFTPGNANSNSDIEEDTAPDVKPDSTRVRGARMVKDIFERVYTRWQDLVKAKGEEDGRANGLERFHHGHVLTRIVCKGSSALGILGEYERELEVLETLIAQKRWRRGQRGRWYERRVSILVTHFPKNDETTERALDAVIDALVDPDTRITCRPKLQRRLRKLENKLRIPIQDRHVCDGILADANEVVFEAVRLRHRAAALKLDRTGRCVEGDTTAQRDQDIKRYYSPTTTSVKSTPGSSVATPSPQKSLVRELDHNSDTPKGKSLWLGRGGEELTVEALALQHYEDQGFKGVHSESRIIAMLFGLLFWDIIFATVPGAFETPYQTAPLDIAEDSFYHARKDLMENRLTVIEAGEGADIIREVDAKHRAPGTWCVGVRWDMFNSEELVDIVKCIGGKALSVICRTLCEDYTFGTSGGPDLFVWNAEKVTCKFVEVKGPGDTLQENQRVWIDILLKAPVEVEICRVVEKGENTDKKPSTKTPKSSRKRAKAKNVLRKKEETEVDGEDADALPLNVFGGSTMEEDSNACSPPGGDVTLGRTAASSARTHIGGTSPGPLKRRADPSEVVLLTPSKKLKVI